MKAKEALKQALLDEYDRLAEESPNRELTLWDVAYSYLTRHGAEGYIITLKADMEILKSIAEGQSVFSISAKMGIKSSYILRAANLWGMKPLEDTLDFNALLVYNKGMTPKELLDNMNEILAVPINLFTADNIIHNIEKYYDFLDFIEEEDE